MWKYNYTDAEKLSYLGAEGAFHEIVPFRGNGLDMSAKWLFNDAEGGIITVLQGH